MDRSTIAAISTPNGFGGIGIIKISGKNAGDIARKLFRKSRGKESAKKVQLSSLDPVFLATNTLTHGYVFDEEKNAFIDEIMICFMKAPKTYTGEDVVEINAHAGPVVINDILQLVLKNGARLATPGEFTRRAYLNGRIDLSQAEAVVDLINAKSSIALENAEKQLSGGLRNSVKALSKQLVSVLAKVEAAIDFPDAVGDDIDLRDQAQRLETKLIFPLKELISRHEAGKTLRDGVRMVIVGRPNVGKSSLMNRLLEKERVIVSDIPGTTRDLIEDMIYMNGVPVIIADSAGLHDSDDPLETIGMEMTKRHLKESHIICFMVEAQRELTESEKRLLKQLSKDRTLIIANKIDLKDTVENQKSLKFPDGFEGIFISAKFDRGIDQLKEAIAKRVIDKERESTESGVVPGIRHKIAFEEAVDYLKKAKELMMNGKDSELAAMDLKCAIDCLGRVTGKVIDEDVLDEIFGSFCLGK